MRHKQDQTNAFATYILQSHNLTGWIDCEMIKDGKDNGRSYEGTVVRGGVSRLEASFCSSELAAVADNSH